MKSKRTINFVDLFSGAGGLSEGFIQASDKDIAFKSIFAVEIDAPSASTYQANFSHSVYTKPIEGLKRELMPRDRVDLVIGGPPCQGFSPLGKMSSTDEHASMNDLWKYYFRVVRWLQPQVFVVENVPEFLKSSQFRQAVRSANFLGYEVTSGVLKAVDFGVPQYRKRGFVIGVKKGIPTMPVRSVDAVQTVRDAIWDLKRSKLVFDLPRNGSLNGFPKYKISQLHLGRNPTPLSLMRYQCVPEGGNRFDLMRKRPDITPRCWLEKLTGSTDVFGRLSWNKPSLTIRTEFFKPEKGCYLHPDQHRPITHWEAARLQTFPDEFMFCGSKTDIARQIGNAVPPRLAQGIAEHIKQYF